ncbi:hypothetical protein F5X68DRAFT_201410 [Plectosphaerella plurivora]|uniref:Uncharacterized protein n=1 Tax=Plectosphaerella plurivora TaxID=936078 RepID=A0A9P8VH23_9PEZI|nr:hypothetical protein F5X68DRAFT_201410 [Plectosphaerella plurivora]
MTSHAVEKGSSEAELPTPADVKHHDRTGLKKCLLTILSLAAIATYWFYPTATILASQRNNAPIKEEEDPNQWPLAKIPESNMPVLAPAFGSYDPYDPEKEYGPSHPYKRYNLKYGKVACWKDGGVWIKKLTPVEMAFLGVDRFHDTERAHEQADEDAFCERLKMQGASFWKLPPQYLENVLWCWAIDSNGCTRQGRVVNAEVGFPTDGGVWFLNTTKGWDWSKKHAVRNALTMDERSEVLKSQDGQFCEDPFKCAKLDALLEGSVPDYHDDI